MTEYLDPEQAFAVVERMGLRLRDPGLLISALARPAASVQGEDAYPTLHLKAAALFSSLVRNHSLVDGNKRIGWVLTLAFLRLNGLNIVMPTDAAFVLVLAVAAGSLELGDIAEQLHPHSAPGA